MAPNQKTPDSEDDGVVHLLSSLFLDRLKYSSKSATLDAVVTSGCWYITFDDAKREIVFDMRALYLGFLGAGLRPQKGNVGDIAQLFQEWLAQKVGNAAITTALVDQRTDLAPARRLLSSGFTLLPSISVGDLQERASSYALRTVERSTFDARHLFAAMIEDGAITKMTLRIFKVSLTEEDIDDLKRDLVERVMRSPQGGETRDRWFRVLGVMSSSLPIDEPSSTPPQVENTVSPFSGDTPSADDKNDVLDTDRDVEALAELVCLDGVTPLAIAIFGDWGSGKSTFMDRLEARVKKLADDETEAEIKTAKARAAGEVQASDEAGMARFLKPIVQIRFNAWHFADANLWASLTAEFFDQLRAGGRDDATKKRHAELVQRVNRHVHALSDTLSANRQAMARNGEAVLEAQQARDQAAERAEEVSGKVFAKTAMNLLSESYAAQKGHLAALGLGGSANEAKAAGVIVDAAKDASEAFGWLRALWGVLGASGKRRWLALPPVVFLVALLVALLVSWVVALVWKQDPKWLDIVAPLLAGGVALAVSFGKALGPALAIARDVAKRGAALAGEIDAENKATVAALVVKETELNKALAEAQALEDAEATSTRALARYVDPLGQANPPRLLRYVLEDDPDTKALEKDIGLIGRTRRLFQAVDSIVEDVRKAREKVREARRERPNEVVPDHPDKETPERIVIYIDDLDRCREDKVYEVLQAIHLLLAFKLFVVVVGVDVKWVRAALTKQFEAGQREDDAGDEEQRKAGENKRNERAMHYLEKIFQIPFWLRPLSSGEDGTFQPYIEMLAGESVETTRAIQAAAEKKRTERAGETPTPEPETTDSGASGQGGDDATSTQGVAAGDADPLGLSGERSEARRVEARRKLQLTEAEITFLSSPEIAALAATAPRGVKRLVNVYRIARARRGQEDRDAVLGGGAGRAPEYPLIALMAAVETGQRFQLAEWFYDRLKGGTEGKVEDLLKPYVQIPPTDVTAPEIETLIAGCVAAAAPRKTGLKVPQLLAAARLVRRYSFNRYR
jgi:hypothetical protein